MKELIHDHKLKIITIFFLCITIITVTATLAIQSTVTNSLVNTFELGEITTTIEENPEIDSTGIIKKDPKVTNQGPNDAMIRMRINVSPSLVKDYLDKYNCIQYNDSNEFDNENNNAYWIYNDNDGFWYYTKIVTSGNTTEPLFKEIKNVVDENGKITDNFKNYIGNYTDFQINLYQEAVQTVIYSNGAVYEKDGVKADVSTEDIINIKVNSSAQLIWEVYNSSNS